MEIQDVLALAFVVTRNMRLGLEDLERRRAYAESKKHVDAVMMLSVLEERFRHEWSWDPDRDVWANNVSRKICGYVQDALLLWDEVGKITADTPAATLVLRLERLVDVERASHLTSVERRIYHATTRQETRKPTPSPAAYAGAWLGVVGLVGATVVVMLQVATTIGYDRSLHWLLAVIVHLVLVYCVIIPLEIIFFELALPSLIVDRLRRLDDPTAFRTYPFAAAIPTSPVFFFCQLEPKYASTRLGRHALAARKSRTSSDHEVFFSDELPGIYEDVTWTPSPKVRAGLRLCAALVALPNPLHKPAFKQLVLAVATLGAGTMSILLNRIIPISETLYGELYFLLAAIVAVVFVVVLVCLYVKSHGDLRNKTTR